MQKRKATRREMKSAYPGGASHIPETQEIDDDNTIDLAEFFKLLKKHLLSIIGVAVLAAAISTGITAAFIPKTYASSGTLFLTPKVEQGEVDYNSLNSNQKLVNNVMNLMTQNNIMTKVAQETGLATADDVREALTIENTPNTEIITVTATTRDAKLSKEIATDTINEFIANMSSSLNVQNIQITDKPKLSYEPVGPSLMKNGAIGGLIGFVGMIALYLVQMLTDKRLKTREEAEAYLGLPVYAELPDLENEKSR